MEPRRQEDKSSPGPAALVLAAGSLLVVAAALAAGCSAQVGADRAVDPDPDGGGDGQGGSTTRAPARADLIGNPDRPPGPGEDAGAAPKAGPDMGGDPISAPVGSFVISEIMYHPVLEEAEFDEHEFLEIHNRTSRDVSITGWKITGTVSYEFITSTSVPAGGYLVVARNPTRLRGDVPAYGLDPQRLFGPYAGELDNGGGTISLVDPAGAVQDIVKYNDKFPWPIAADALGAGDSWFAAGDPRLPFKAHKYRGISLERINNNQPADVSNWSPSPLDGATPGKGPASSPAEPAPIVTGIGVIPQGGQLPILQDQKITVKVNLSSAASKPPRLEWFVDDLARTDEVRATLDLAPEADGSHSYVATIPAQKGNAIVRYRVSIDRGGWTQLSPRPSDPFAWHAFFVAAAADPPRRTHSLFLTQTNWTTLWQNLKGGLWQGPDLCTLNQTWNNRVPAVFVHDGRVYDVMARYSGSYYHRVRGQNVDLAKWKGSPAPKDPTPLTALSWSIKFPAYNQFQNKGAIILNKMNNNCSGIEWSVTSKIFKSIGIPAPAVTFARLNINGGYFHYTMEVESWGKDVLERTYGADLGKGDLFDVNGIYGNPDGNAVYGAGDGSEIGPRCGFSATERYRATYSRATPSWKGEANDEVVKLVKDLNTARRGGAQALRAFFQASFDGPSLIDYMAVTEWAAAWDDIAHNYMLYRFPVPKSRWTMLPWDFDNHIGGVDWPGGARVSKPATASFYIGKAGDPWSMQGPSLWKDSFFQVFDTEYKARLKQLADDKLNPAKSVFPLIDQWRDEFNKEDFTTDPVAKFCDPWSHADRMKKWVTDRDAALRKVFP